MNAPNAGSWPSPGPLETASFPNQLRARVVTPGAQPRIHGYDVESDLAHNYSPSAVAFLAVTGELPNPEVEAALDAILVFAAPVSVACAPTHAAVLAQLCGAPWKSVISVAAIGLAEQVRFMLDEHEEFLNWLRTPSAEVPERYLATSDEEAATVERLRRELAYCRLHVPALVHRLAPAAAVIASLSRCGVTTRQALEVLLVWVRLPLVLAEASTQGIADLKNYPINLPQYVYEESDR
jgi:hypothetical protein